MAFSQRRCAGLTIRSMRATDKVTSHSTAQARLSDKVCPGKRAGQIRNGAIARRGPKVARQKQRANLHVCE